MDSYGACGQITAVAASPGKTALAVRASALTRAVIHYFECSIPGTPADNGIAWLMRRSTSLGTATAVTPQALDAGAPASQLSAAQEFSAEPTFGGTIFDLAVHQRSLYQWNAAPGRELRIPAIAAAGIAMTPVHAAYAGVASAVMHWTE